MFNSSFIRKSLEIHQLPNSILDNLLDSDNQTNDINPHAPTEAKKPSTMVLPYGQAPPPARKAPPFQIFRHPRCRAKAQAAKGR